ncbi:putative NRPS-like protein biosynthetic cluster [Microsporum canis]
MKFDWPPTLVQRVLDMCRLYSTEPAIQEKSRVISYSQLARRMSSLVSTILHSATDIVGSHIAVLCEPSADAIISMLAVLHCGAIYVPLDTNLPISRLVAMMNDCKPALLLMHAGTEEQAQAITTGYLIQEVRVDIVSEQASYEVPSIYAAEQDAPAILLYTSGSTGAPKGILLSQASFINHLAAKKEALHLCRERVLQQSSLGFDMSIIQTFCAIANGGLLVIIPSDLRHDPHELTTLMARSRITLTIATPSEYTMWINYGGMTLKENTSWRYACMGGEMVSQHLRNELRRLDIRALGIWNCYGPTEITAAATFYEIDLKAGNDSVARYAVGKALSNYSISILDEYGNPQPVEHTGEICIGGAGVALGYLNLVEESQRKFVTMSGMLGIDLGQPKQRFYRTGDQGKLMQDGTLLLLSRLHADTQIKLHGVRIEMQEVETALLCAANGLLSTVVVSRRDEVLVAHATITSGKEHITNREEELSAILRRLRLLLPRYSVPVTIAIIPKMITNANGKVDRKAISALPISENSSITERQLGRMTVREGELRLLWERALPKISFAARISPSSDFFLCGGNSLSLMKLQTAIRESMGIVVSTRILYHASTLSRMAEYISNCLQEEQHRQEAENIVTEINWTTETSIPLWLHEQISTLNTLGATSIEQVEMPQKVPSGIEILLTGATSVLGGFLLRSLMQSPTIHRVHCVAVPADEEHLLPEDQNSSAIWGVLHHQR